MMQQTLFELLGIPEGSDPTLIERLFQNKLNALIKEALEDRSDEVKDKTLNDISIYYAKLHDYYQAWAKNEQLAHKHLDDPAYTSTKKAARNMIDKVYKHMVRSERVHYELARHSYQLETEASEMGEITKENLVEASRLGVELGTLFSKNTQKKIILSEKLQKHVNALDVVAKIDKKLDAIQKILEGLYNKDKAQAPMRSIASAFRTENFMRARTVFREIKEAKEKSLLGGNKSKQISEIDNLIKETTELIKSNAKLIVGEDQRVMLHTNEVIASHNEILDDLNEVREFMIKNYSVYLRHKFVSMRGLEQQVESVASSKNLIAQYRKLTTCIAEPMKDLKQSRYFENDVIEPLQRQIQAAEPVMDQILVRAEELISVLRTVQVEFTNLSTMSLTKL